MQELDTPAYSFDRRVAMALTRDDFEYWLFEMDDALESFFREVPADIRCSLDYSPVSLNVLETWLMTRYENTKAILRSSEKRQLDLVARYVGETFRKNIGGVWTIDLDNPKNAFYRIPVLRKQGEWEECPATLVTASLDRRTGTYMEKVLRHFLQRMNSSK